MTGQLIISSIQLLLKSVMEKSTMLGIILVFIIILVSLYYEFYDIIDRFVRNHPGFIMAVIILLLTLVLMLFIGLFIGIDQIDLPLTIVTEKNLDARITSKGDEAITSKVDEACRKACVFIIISFLVCACIGCYK